jgi:hypothetical protein
VFVEVDTSRRILGLAPAGVCRAVRVATQRGGLLLHRFTLALSKDGGLFSVALSVAANSRQQRPGITWQLIQWSPDFPRINIVRYLCAIAQPIVLSKYNN